MIKKCKCGGIPFVKHEKGKYSIRCIWCDKSTGEYSYEDTAVERWQEIAGVTPRVRGFEPVYNAPSDTILPVQGSDSSAGYDFFSPCDITIAPNSYTDLIPLNIKAYMNPDEYLALHIRSSLGTKHKVTIAQATGIIDADYYSNSKNDGNIGVMLHNGGDKVVDIKKGDRIVQGIFSKYLKADNTSSLGKRDGGYGSTGK